MPKSRRYHRLEHSYRFAGFRPDRSVTGVFGDRYARVVTLHRRSKKRRAGRAAGWIIASTIGGDDAYETCHAATPEYFWISRSAASIVCVAAR